MAQTFSSLTPDYLPRPVLDIAPVSSHSNERRSINTIRRSREEIELTNISHHPTTDLPAPSISNTSMHPPKRLKTYQTALYAVMFLEGWYDASAGPLLPIIQKHYHLNFTIVSMLFVASAAGFAAGAIVNIPLTDRYGLGKIITVCAAIQTLAFALLAPALPFPIMCVAYGLMGFTMANAQCNVFISSLPGNASSAMGLLHGFYGFGALSAPLAATQFAQTSHWSFYFLISLGLAIFNVAFSLFAFKLNRLEDLIPERNAPSTAGGEAETTPLIQDSKYKAILRQKQVYLLAAFTMVYVGAEVTIGGWIVTFLDELRGGGPSAGYVSSGFFGGITLGRFVLWPVNDLLGKTRAIYFYIVAAIGLEMIVWLVPSLVTNAVAVSAVGVALGPLYPIVMNVAAEVLPKWILAGSIGIVASTGQMGSALFPFLTGLLATSHGVQILQPLVIGLFGLMIVLWIVFMMNTNRRTD